MTKMEKKNESLKTDYLSTATSLTTKSIDFSKIDKNKIEEYIELAVLYLIYIMVTHIHCCHCRTINERASN